MQMLQPFQKTPAKKKKAKDQLKINLQIEKELRKIFLVKTFVQTALLIAKHFCKIIQMQQSNVEKCSAGNLKSASTSLTTKHSDASDVERLCKHKACDNTDAAIKSIGESL